jgi:hypothetical protein
LVQLRDTLALKDFVSDIKGMIYRRAWEGVSHHGAADGASPRRAGGDSDEEERQTSEDLLLQDDTHSAHSASSSRGPGSRHFHSSTISSRPALSGALDDSTHSRGSTSSAGHASEDIESSIELIESVLNDVLLPSASGYDDGGNK